MMSSSLNNPELRASFSKHPTVASTPPRPAHSVAQQQVEDTPQRVIRNWLDALDLDLGLDSLANSRSLTARLSLSGLEGFAAGGISGIDLTGDAEDESVGDDLLEKVFTGRPSASAATARAPLRNSSSGKRVTTFDDPMIEQAVAAAVNNPRHVVDDTSPLGDDTDDIGIDDASSVSLSLPDSFGASYLFEQVADRVKGGQAKVINKQTSCPR